MERGHWSPLRAGSMPGSVNRWYKNRGFWDGGGALGKPGMPSLSCPCSASRWSGCPRSVKSSFKTW